MVISTRSSRSDFETQKVAPAENAAEVKSSEQVLAVQIAEELIAGVEKQTRAVAPAHKHTLPVRLARSILAFYDDLGGPPMTQRDRVHQKIESSAAERKYGPWPI